MYISIFHTENIYSEDPSYPQFSVILCMLYVTSGFKFLLNNSTQYFSLLVLSFMLLLGSHSYTPCKSLPNWRNNFLFLPSGHTNHAYNFLCLSCKDTSSRHLHFGFLHFIEDSCQWLLVSSSGIFILQLFLFNHVSGTPRIYERFVKIFFLLIQKMLY